MLLLQIYYTNFHFIHTWSYRTDRHTHTYIVVILYSIMYHHTHGEGHSDIIHETYNNHQSIAVFNLPYSVWFRLEERPWNPTDVTVLSPHHFLSDSQQWWVTESQDCWYFLECLGHWLSLKREFEEKGPWQFDQRAVVLVGSPSVLAGRLVRPRLAVGVEVTVGGVAPPL